jgi:hypothetical protein
MRRLIPNSVRQWCAKETAKGLETRVNLNAVSVADANSLRKLNRVNFCKLLVTDNVVVNYVPWFAGHVRRRVLSWLPRDAQDEFSFTRRQELVRQMYVGPYKGQLDSFALQMRRASTSIRLSPALALSSLFFEYTFPWPLKVTKQVQLSLAAAPSSAARDCFGDPCSNYSDLRLCALLNYQ